MAAVESLPQKPKAKSPARHEIDAFVEKYELYADLYGDPVEVAFQVMAHHTSDAEDADREVALRAADMLMSYRYPRIKAIQGQQGQNGPQFTFNIDLSGRPAPQMAPTIDLNAAPALPAGPVVDLSGIFPDE